MTRLKQKIPNTAQAVVNCVGVICFRGDEVLLIRRGKAPRKGDWSIPGGRIEPNETEEQAALRELYEETSITAQLGSKIIALPATFEGTSYMLHDYMAEWESGTPQAGDDADEACFIPMTEIRELNMWPKTTEVIQMAYQKRASLLKKGA